MIGIDTNIVLRWLLGASLNETGDSRQHDAIIAIAGMADEVFFINHLVLAETLWVLRSKAKLPRSEILSVVGSLIDTGNIQIQDLDAVIEAIGTYKDHPGDFSDHLIGVVNRRNGCATTLTFDKAAARSPNFSELKG